MNRKTPSRTNKQQISTKTTIGSKLHARVNSLKNLNPPEVNHSEKIKRDEINRFAREIAGEEGLKIITCIDCNGTTDDQIEKTTSMKIAEIRSVLNHLHSYGLVEYAREKNLQTGWFTYTWKLNMDRALQNFISMTKREYERLHTKLAVGDGAQVYECGKGCSGEKIDFDKALEVTFKCPGCNTKLAVANYDVELKRLEEKIKLLTEIKNHTPVASRPASISPQVAEKTRTTSVELAKLPTLSRR